MTNQIASERLQPCLLDRLTDEEPLNQLESRNQRIISFQRYRRGVFRDLEWLLNASSLAAAELDGHVDLSKYPEVVRSVVNYGSRQLSGISAPDMEALQQDMKQVLEIFEPRLRLQTVEIRASQDRHLVSLEIHGELWANPVPEQLHIKTTVDLETGQCLLGDASNG